MLTPRGTKRNLALRPYFAIADGLALLFRPVVEAVIHDIRSDTIVHIANSFSPREVGDSSDLPLVPFSPTAQVIGPYEKVGWDGRRIKSISVVLRDSKQLPIGLLCINTDLTQFESVWRILDSFISTDTVTAPPEKFQDDWHDRINRFIAAWTAKRATTIDRLDRNARRALIQALHASDAFEGRRATVYVARVLGISRATIYNELARLKGKVAA